MSDFTAGFASRLDDAARALAVSYAEEADEGFAPRDLKALAGGTGWPPAPAPTGEAGPADFAPQPISARFQKPAAAAPSPEDDAPASSFEPIIDPVVAARAAGYADGYRDAQDQGAADRARDQVLLQDLAAALQSIDRIDRDMIATRLRQTVLALVTRMVGETGISAEVLAARVTAAVDLLADNAEAAVLHLNPEDLPLVRDHLPPLLHPVADAQQQRGTFVLESPSTLVEDGPELWLDQLTHAIDRVAVPPLC